MSESLDRNGALHGNGGRYVSLRDHIETIIDERDKLYQERWQSQQHELTLAQREMERRLEHLNELREQVVADRSKYVTRELFDAQMQPLNDLRSKAVVIIAAASLFAGGMGAIIGALIIRITGGS